MVIAANTVTSTSAANVRASKSMSWVLRHGALEENIPMCPDGFIKMSDLLSCRRMRGITLDTVHYIAQTNDKNRFEIKVDEKGLEWIRARQGHSIILAETLNAQIVDTSELTEIVHGTFREVIPAIFASNGLSRMTRQHIHFSPVTDLSTTQVIAGLRKQAQVFIYLDVQSILDLGITLEKSGNNVVLSPGNEEGRIPASCFLRIVDRKGRVEWQKGDPA